MVPLVAFSGSRALPLSARGIVRQVARAVSAGGRGLAVGCATGADTTALSWWLSHQPRAAHVFAVGSACGQGYSARWSNLALVRHAAASGATVHWLSGGALHWPLAVRLASRSGACVRAALASGSGSALVAFPCSPPPRPWQGRGPWWSCGSGTWSTVAFAAQLGLPVFVFPVGPLAGGQLPQLPLAGSWLQGSPSGLWSQGFRFAPAPGPCTKGATLSFRDQ